LGLCESDFARLDEFFLRHGILEELEARRKTNDAAELMRLRVEAREMVLPSGMAGSFQVLVLEKKPLK
jgi:SAM-dependent MidA family methyltransferase